MNSLVTSGVMGPANHWPELCCSVTIPDTRTEKKKNKWRRGNSSPARRLLVCLHLRNKWASGSNMASFVESGIIIIAVNFDLCRTVKDKNIIYILWFYKKTIRNIFSFTEYTILYSNKVYKRQTLLGSPKNVFTFYIYCVWKAFVSPRAMGRVYVTPSRKVII